jgi:hypothetical protein
MRRISGLKLLDEREGAGTLAKKGDRVVYNTKIFLNQGDEVRSMIFKRSNCPRRWCESRQSHIHRSHHRTWPSPGDRRCRACVNGNESRRLSESPCEPAPSLS